MFNAIKHLFTAISPKKLTMLAIGFFVVLLVTLSFFRPHNNSSFLPTNQLAHHYDDVRLSDAFIAPLYSSLVKNRQAIGITDSHIEETILPYDTQSVKIDRDHQEFGHLVSTYHQSHGVTTVSLLNRANSITFKNPHDVAGIYYLALDYHELENNIDNTQIGIRINQQTPFYESMTLVLPSVWTFASSTFLLDRYQNEIQPSSIKQKAWKTHAIDDYKGMHPGLFGFYLEGHDEIEIYHVNGHVLVGNLYFVLQPTVPTYEAYLNTHGDKPVIDQLTMISARDMTYRNDPSIRLRSEQDPSNLYYDTQFLKLNVIFGDSWQNNGQSISYDIEVPQSGYYHVSFKYRQYLIRDMSVFRKITVNGQVPFDLLESYAFPYTTSFINRTLVDEDEKPLKIYLNEGINVIRLQAVNYPYRQTIETIQYVMREIQGLSLNIKRYTSGGTDRYRDWDIDTYFPEAANHMLFWADLLEEEQNRLRVVSTIQDPSEISNLRVASIRLRDIAKDINKLPGRMAQFSDGDASINQMLGNTMQRLLRSNLELERLMFHGDQRIPRPHAHVFVNAFEGVKRLVLSFVNNPYSVSARQEDELMVWVNHPRQYIEIMQALIDQKYNGPKKITLSQMPDQNKLILANASGQAPDIAIGVNHWIPYEFAIRDASLDLRQFSGYEELVQNFTKGAMIPFVFEQGVFGLPATQNFWVTYYRKDILESIGITEIPQTWDEIIAILPLLQSYGMNYFVPLAQFSGLKPFVATLPFIYQFGGDLYTEDGMRTNINSDQTLRGIRLMSELFTLYNLPKFVASFYNHFRYGLLPIGISDLSTYLLLQTAAVELDGLWGMDLHPGVYHPERDEIVRYSAVGGQANMILSATRYPEESWDFLKWWMSTEIQSEFAFVLQSTYGKAYFWNTANVNAFKQIPMPQEYKDIVLRQWEFGIEASRIPGNYMVERELSNAWTKIVFDGTNPRQALDEAVRISNREILYKMAEFGYTRQGVIIKEYIVPSIYNIDLWLTEVRND